jgi:hypothetical protein
MCGSTTQAVLDRGGEFIKPLTSRYRAWHCAGADGVLASVQRCCRQLNRTLEGVRALCLSKQG